MRKLGAIVAIVLILSIGYEPIKHLGRTSASVNFKAKASVIKKQNVATLQGIDPLMERQWMISYTKSDEAWKLINIKLQRNPIKIAVVDSGIDYNNPDLKYRVLKDKGYNFINNSKDAMDDMGHGTQVAGIIAGEQGNASGISGIVGPLNVKMIPIKVLNNKGIGDGKTIAKGIIYAVDQGVDIINVSIDFDNHDRYIRDALNYANYYKVMVVVASGNSNSNCDNYSPAGDIGAYTVAAVNSKSERASFSSYGHSVSVTAPGVDIITTSINGKFESVSGTSMAAPIVTGIAAMIKAQNYSLNSSDIQEIINNTSTDIIKKGKDIFSGYGVINAYKAVLAAQRPDKH